MKIDFDFRLLDVSLELYALEEYLELIEQYIERAGNSERLNLAAAITKGNLTPDDPEWHKIHQNYEGRIEFLLPRILRSPFLVSLYAVYESAVTEIARLIQERKGLAISLDNSKGDNFLDRAKKYYKHDLGFELCKDNSAWQQINMLSELRNALAHANGRLKMLKEQSRKRILDWEKRGIGVHQDSGYIVVDAAFARKTFRLVRGSLDDLVARFKEWDGPQGSV